MNELQKLIESNQEFKAKAEALDKDPKATVADIIALAKEYGVEIAETDFRAVPAEGELSDDELEAVAGGGDCYCVLGGGGSAGKHCDTCACVIYGVGMDDQNRSRCQCPTVGDGTDW